MPSAFKKMPVLRNLALKNASWQQWLLQRASQQELTPSCPTADGGVQNGIPSQNMYNAHFVTGLACSVGSSL